MKGQSKDTREERFAKEAKRCPTLGYFLYFGKINILYVCACKDCR
jgi:hypothetical protein